MRDPQMDGVTTRLTSEHLQARIPSGSGEASLGPARAHAPSGQREHAYTTQAVPRAGAPSSSPFSMSPHYSAHPYQPAVHEPTADRRAMYPPSQEQRAWREGPPPAAAQPAPKPPVPVHRCYSLRCSSCDMFLSDRGMRAVLLLKPNIILFSTDAAPLNAGPAWPTEGVAQNDDVDPADFDPSGLPAPPVEPAVERTCDCLTSSLACHGCGATVGYHIVQPCARCTASVARHQRSANHHRYVFHHNEVTSTERRYFPGEPGIVPLHPLTHNTAAILQRTRSPTPPVEPAEKGEAPSSASRRRERHTQSPFPQRRAGDVLRAGDTVYWHNLAPGGERSRPVDPHTRPARIAQRAAR